MGTKVYIETSVVSYYTARPSRHVVIAGHQQVTHDFWARLGSDFEPFVSVVVIDEASEGNPEQAEKRLQAIRSFLAIRTTPEAETLAQQIIVGKGIPAEYPEDALHIALAAMGGVDFIVTWNFAHINNPFTRLMIRQIVENEGLGLPGNRIARRTPGRRNMKDSIVAEVRQYRMEHTKRFHSDLALICEDLRKREAALGDRLVSPQPKPLRAKGDSIAAR